MIAVEALIKLIFASTFIEADPEPSQTSKIELFAELFNYFKSLTVFAETFILVVWLCSEYACFMATKYRETWLG